MTFPEPIECEVVTPAPWEWEDKFTTRTQGREIEVLMGRVHFGTIGMNLQGTTFELPTPPQTWQQARARVMKRLPSVVRQLQPSANPSPPPPPSVALQLHPSAKPPPPPPLPPPAKYPPPPSTASHVASATVRFKAPPLHFVLAPQAPQVPLLTGGSDYVAAEYVGPADAEPAAHISPEEARIIQAELWASGVQRLAAEEVRQSLSSHSAQTSSESRLVLLALSRHPREMHDVLRNSELARSLAEEGVDVLPPWANGAFVLGRGIAEDSIADVADKLGKWHVAVWEEEEELVMDSLRSLPYNIRPRLKQGGRIPVPGSTSLFGDTSDDNLTAGGASSSTDLDLLEAADQDLITISIGRTFIHVQVAKSSPRTVHTV